MGSQHGCRGSTTPISRSAGHHGSGDNLISAAGQNRAGPLGYYTSAGPAYGPLRHCDVSGTISVLEALGQPLPVGVASCIGVDAAGAAVWKLCVRGRDQTGRWVVLHRRFQPAQ
jgi:hypothetical protein